jgi:predicted transcriptional regulator
VASAHELGPLEMEVLGLVEKLGACDVAAIRAALSQKGSELAYTTVMTVLSRLHEKGALTREKQGKRFVYGAARGGAALKSSMLKRIQAALFKGKGPASLVALLEAERLSSDELRELRRWVNARLKERGQ